MDACRARLACAIIGMSVMHCNLFECRQVRYNGQYCRRWECMVGLEQDCTVPITPCSDVLTPHTHTHSLTLTLIPLCCLLFIIWIPQSSISIVIRYDTMASALRNNGNSELDAMERQIGWMATGN